MKNILFLSFSGAAKAAVKAIVVAVAATSAFACCRQSRTMPETYVILHQAAADGKYLYGMQDALSYGRA